MKLMTDPKVEFLQTAVDTLKATIAKNGLEIKKLKESNDIKAKRIINLESQLKEATETLVGHKCVNEIQMCGSVYFQLKDR